MTKSNSRRVAIIGGGAGGLAAAIAAGRAGADVTIYEMANRVGKKLLKTGNGRCNLTNRNVSPEGYNHPDFARPLLERTDCAALLDFFGGLGLITVTDSEGRVYPRSDTSASVLDVLRLGCNAAGARELCSTEIALLRPAPQGGFLLRPRQGNEEHADAVIVATGGGTGLVRTLGHPMVPFSPVLCPLKTDAGPIRGLSGLRVHCRVNLLRKGRSVYAEEGEVLFRDYGVSGIVILNMSRYAQPGDELSLDLMPEWNENELADKLSHRPFAGAELLTGLFHRRVAEALTRNAGGCDPAALAHAIKDLRLKAEGPADAQSAQVTRGGADVDSFDQETLESRIMPGLYVIGEALDMDGRCGGWNLHWAFASGLAAGRSAANG